MEVTGLRRAKQFCHFQRNPKVWKVTIISRIFYILKEKNFDKVTRLERLRGHAGQNDSAIFKSILKVAQLNDLNDILDSEKYFFNKVTKLRRLRGYAGQDDSVIFKKILNRVTGLRRLRRLRSYTGQNDSVIFKEILKFSKLQRFQWFFKFWKIFL